MSSVWFNGDNRQTYVRVHQNVKEEISLSDYKTIPPISWSLKDK